MESIAVASTSEGEDLGYVSVPFMIHPSTRLALYAFGMHSEFIRILKDRVCQAQRARPDIVV
jgi:hypothetical protein